jgi:type IV secretory pathway TrbF-like protein
VGRCGASGTEDGVSTATAQHRYYGAPSTHPAGLAETPHVRARREWDARLGTAVVQARSWRVNSMVLASLLGVSLLGNVFLGMQPKVVPHIIEVDALGEATYRGPVGSGGAAFKPDEPLVRYQLRRWIELTRTVSSDNVLLRKNWIDAYKMLTLKGNTLMTAWVVENDPFKRAQKETTAVEILSAVPLSAESWQIDWRETTWDKSGQTIGSPVIWRALLKVVVQTPKTRQMMIDNPLGLFVDELHWDRIQAARP